MSRLNVAVFCVVAASGCTSHKPSEAAQAVTAPAAQAAKPASAAVPEVKPAATASTGTEVAPPDAGAETGDDDAPWPTLPQGKSSRAEPLKVEELDDGTSCRSWEAYTADTVMFGEFGENSVTRVFKGRPKGECGARASTPLMTVKLGESCTAGLLVPDYLLLDCDGSPSTYYVYSIRDDKRVFGEQCLRVVVGVDWFDCVVPAQSEHACAANDGGPSGYGAYMPVLVRHFDARTGEVTQVDPKACVYAE